MSVPAFLSIEGLAVRLGGRVVLHDVTMEFPRGRMVALVGPNGAGKTTLLRALAGLLSADGIIRLDGKAVSTLTVRERAIHFAYLPQDQSVHWPLPARDVVALGRYPHGAVDPAHLPSRDGEAVERAMVATDVVAFAGRPICDLSGGERGRVLLARVLAVEAPVILADEPTASLDPRHQLEVIRLLRAAAAAGGVIFVATHDLGLAARFADTVVVLDGGRVAAHGPPGMALAPQVLADVFRVGAFRTDHGGEPVIVPWTVV
ncbi:ABC transporter ATP-binding protein [Xanthobacteraceae bacterium Astr-EGSB]|uniref:ABC transporter ATP-binding protein n=1 Tax=Astrobacterium formosum TaxID=3069710 RepID=UPI0027AF39FB|nr:ABC transporter ATP-binding protein [Xanthobacteraceae bacterium Astr-EGSB]